MAPFDAGEETGFSGFILVPATETFQVEASSPAVSRAAQEVLLHQADQGRTEPFLQAGCSAEAPEPPTHSPH